MCEHPTPGDKLTRREFIKILAGVGGALLVGPAIRLRASDGTALDTPTTLMFHTKDRWQLQNILKWLKDNGYQSVNYRQLTQAINGEAILPAKPVIISIDDIGSDFINPYFMAMADIVEKEQMHGVFGVVTNGTLKASPLNWKTLRELSERGFEMDTHTHSHTSLPQMRSLAQLRQEIAESAQWIEDGTGKRPEALIAPFGNVYSNLSKRAFDTRIFDISAEAKLNYVVGIVEGRSLDTSGLAPYYVGRLGISHQMDEMAAWIKNFRGKK